VTRPARHRLRIPVLALVLAAGLMPAAAGPVAATTPVFINEIHYDNTGTDAGEAIEIAGPTGTDLTGWSLVLYNGATGASYATDVLGGTIPNQQNGMGTVFVSYPVNGIQNGAPDGVALVDATSAVIQFLSYEGTFTAVDGPANGMTSTGIGVAENGTEPLGQSLQLQGSGASAEQFSWSTPISQTFGAANTGQTFAPATVPPVASCGSALLATHGHLATSTVTGSDVDGVVTGLAIDSVTPDPGTIWIGPTTPAAGTGGTASAVVAVGATTPVGTYTVVVQATNSDPTPQSGTCTLEVSVESGPSIDRLRALVDEFVASGELSAKQAGLLSSRLDRAATFLARGKTDAYRSQLEAFGDQAQDFVPTHLGQAAADALKAEADLLRSL
jgi:hypothetical protein